MTSPGPVPPLAPDELVSTGDERQVLETFLDLYRDIPKRKLADLSDQEIRQRHVPSQTTLGGLVKHLSAVEQEWFQVVLAGRARDGDDASASDDGWTLSSDDTTTSLLDRYERACAASRQIASGFSLEDRVGTASTRRTAWLSRSQCHADPSV